MWLAVLVKTLYNCHRCHQCQYLLSARPSNGGPSAHGTVSECATLLAVAVGAGAAGFLRSFVRWRVAWKAVELGQSIGL